MMCGDEFDFHSNLQVRQFSTKKTSGGQSIYDVRTQKLEIMHAFRWNERCTQFLFMDDVVSHPEGAL